MNEPQDEPFAVVFVKDQDWRLLEPRLAGNYELMTRINADADRFPNQRKRRVALLVREADVVGLCLARYQSHSADVDHMIALDHLRRFDPPIRAQHLVSRLQNEFRGPVADAVRRGGSLTKQETADMAVVLSSDALHLALLEELRDLLRELPTTESKAALRRAEQRDAVAVALEAVGLDSRQSLPASERDEADPLPFLHGLETMRAREASLIRHDFQRIPGWLHQEVPSERLDCAVFSDPSNGKERITVVYADKEKLEEVTGTDLIYYRTHQPGYVMVQYKRMTPISDGSEEYFYPSEGNLDEEIRRMRKIMPRSPDWLHTPADYRLSPEPFYLKLVDSQVSRREAHKLASGMYFPLALFETMLESKDHRGLRGRQAISRRNAPKHLSNDLFVQLLKGGWIGTAGRDSDDMTGMIKHLLGQKRSVILAEDHRDPADGWGNTRRSRDWGSFPSVPTPTCEGLGPAGCPRRDGLGQELQDCPSDCFQRELPGGSPGDAPGL